MNSVRQPAVAGAFYPDNEGELKEMISAFLEQGRGEVPGVIRGLIAPHAGYVYSGPVAASGYRLVGKRTAVDKVILVGPSHHAPFPGVAEAGYEFWSTPLGMVKAGSLRNSVKTKELFKVYPNVHEPEHCLEVQLPFLQTVLEGDFTIFPLLTGEILPDVLARELVRFIDESTLFVASSDLSHYHPYKKAVSLDSEANRAIPSLDFKGVAGVEACGRLAIMTLMHIAKEKGWKGKLLDYRNSGDTAGPKDSVVGYGCYAFYEV